MFVCDILTWEWWIFIKIEIFPTIFLCPHSVCVSILAPSSLKSLELKKIDFWIELVMIKTKIFNLNLRAQPKYGMPEY